MKKVVLAALVAVLAIAPATAAELTGTLKKIKDSGTIVIGHRDGSRPFSFIDENGKPAGYTIDLCNRVVQSVKQTLGLADLKVEYVPLAAADRIAAVAGGKVDIECGNSTITLSRLEDVDFSNMTFITGASLLVKADSGEGLFQEEGREVFGRDSVGVGVTDCPWFDSSSTLLHLFKVPTMPPETRAARFVRMKGRAAPPGDAM